MKKIVRVGKCEDGNIFAKIELKEGNLSISGVIGPTRDGNAKGSAGQFIMSFKEYDERGYMSLKDITPAPGWDRATIKKFFDVWDKWHLNDMKAGCAHQVGPEWTHKSVKIYHFTLTDKAYKFKKQAEEDAQKALVNGETFTPTPEQVLYAGLPYSIESPYEKTPVHYQPTRQTSYSRPVETKNTGWLKPTEHPEGFLTKPCPVCGYKYGTKWNRVELPEEVVSFLESLPDTDITPAWV